MKQTLFTLFIFSNVLFFTSCKKGNTISNAQLARKWKLTSLFYGYANGGNFLWNPIPSGQTEILTFSKEGTFTESVNGTPTCSGTYQLKSAINLERVSSCNTSILKNEISTLTADTLVIDFFVREGRIKYKYASVQ